MLISYDAQITKRTQTRRVVPIHSCNMDGIRYPLGAHSVTTWYSNLVRQRNKAWFQHRLLISRINLQTWLSIIGDYRWVFIMNAYYSKHNSKLSLWNTFFLDMKQIATVKCIGKYYTFTCTSTFEGKFKLLVLCLAEIYVSISTTICKLVDIIPALHQ